MVGQNVLLRVSRKEVIKRLKVFKKRATKKYPNIKSVILVGSVALNTHSARSDVDVVLIYQGNEPDYVYLKKTLSECVELPADLIMIEQSRIPGLSPKLRKEWFEKGVLIE